MTEKLGRHWDLGSGVMNGEFARGFPQSGVPSKGLDNDVRMSLADVIYPSLVS